MTDPRPFLIRDAIVGNPTPAEKSAAVAALGDLLASLGSADRIMRDALSDEEAPTLLDRLMVAERDLAEARRECEALANQHFDDERLARDLRRDLAEARAAWKACNDRLAELTRVDNLAIGGGQPT